MKKYLLLALLILIISPLYPSDSLVKKEEIAHIINVADSLATKGKTLESIVWYKKAAIIYEEKHDWRNAYQTLITISDKYFAKRNPDPALTLLESKLASVKKNIGAIDTLTAMVLHKIGVGYFWKKEFLKAIDNYKKALFIRKSLLLPRHKEIIRGHNNIGACYETIGQLDSALQHLHKSLELQLENPTELISTTFRALGRAYERLGAYNKAENYYLANLNISIRLEKANWAIADEHLEMSHFYHSLNLPEKVIGHAEKAIELYQSISDKTKEDYAGIANCYHNLGVAWNNLNQIEKSLDYFKKAINIGELGWTEKGFAITYDYIGVSYKQKKEYQKAMSYFQKAVNIYKKNNDALYLSKTYDNIGDLFFDQKRFKQALKNYHLSKLFLLPDIKKINIYDTLNLKDLYILDKQLLLTSLFAKANTFKYLYDIKQSPKNLLASFDTYKLLDELIDQIRLSYLEDASKSYLVKETKPIYEKAIGICLQYHQLTKDKKYLEQAYKYVEKSKAIILLEQIKESRANNFSGIPDSIKQKEKELKIEIGQIEKKLALHPSNIETDSIKANLSEQLIYKKRAYEELIKSLEKNNAAYHQLKYDLETIKTENIQQQILRDSQTLLEYFIGADSIFCFKITKDDHQVFSQAKDFPLKSWVDSLRQGIYYCRNNTQTNERDCEQLDLLYAKYASKLYNKLVAPLNIAPSNKQLIIVPDGVLGYIPFDALLTKEITIYQSRQFQKYPYWGLNQHISYAYSATFLKELQKAPINKSNKKLLAYAPSFQIKQPIVVQNLHAQRGNLTPLLFSQKEVENISQFFNGKLVNKKEANKANFLKEAPNYRYLHLASHGKMNDLDADLSYIAFTQYGDSINQEELLYLRELYDMEINADMVVLSACETGIGALQNGEGIISLARGFSYAGAQSIITSLWSVNDQKTADLMKAFYRNLAEGMEKDIALSEAKRSYINTTNGNFAHPFYWAGFIPIGNMDSIESEPDWTWGVLAIISSLLLIGIFFYWKSIKDNKIPPETI